MNSTELTIEVYSKALYHAQTADYVSITAFVSLLYDSTITIADEVSGVNCAFKTHDSATFVKVQVIWPGALTFPKLLYYINRYLMIAISLYWTSGLFIYYREGIISILTLRLDPSINIRGLHSTARVFYCSVVRSHFNVECRYHRSCACLSCHEFVVQANVTSIITTTVGTGEIYSLVNLLCHFT